jgi:hypothetical protein
MTSVQVAQQTVSSMMERLSTVDNIDTTDPRFQTHSRSDAQILEVITADHRVLFFSPNESLFWSCCLSWNNANYFCMQGLIILPHSVVRCVPRGDIRQLLQAQWLEHMAEARLLADHSRKEGIQFQLALIKQRQERAQLEVDIYDDVLGQLTEIAASKPGELTSTSSLIMLNIKMFSSTCTVNLKVPTAWSLNRPCVPCHIPPFYPAVSL